VVSIFLGEVELSGLGICRFYPAVFKAPSPRCLKSCIYFSLETLKVVFSQFLEQIMEVWNAVTMASQFQISKPIIKLVFTTRALIDQPHWHSVSQAVFL